MIIALASPRVASTLDQGLKKIERLISDASAQGAEIVCFPEAYLPGLRGQDFEVGPWDKTQQEWALQAVAQMARLHEVATIFGVAICHEGWRYPETVRWAAVRGAKIVFHPQHTGSDQESATSLIDPSGRCQAHLPMERKASSSKPSTWRRPPG